MLKHKSLKLLQNEFDRYTRHSAIPGPCSKLTKIPNAKNALFIVHIQRHSLLEGRSELLGKDWRSRPGSPLKFSLTVRLLEDRAISVKRAVFQQPV